MNRDGNKMIDKNDKRIKNFIIAIKHAKIDKNITRDTLADEIGMGVNTLSARMNLHPASGLRKY